MTDHQAARQVVDSAPDGVAAVIHAWCDPGPSPAVHADMRTQLEQQWPVLAFAVQRLVAEYADLIRWPSREVAEWFRPGQVKNGPKHARPDHEPEPDDQKEEHDGHE